MIAEGETNPPFSVPTVPQSKAVKPAFTDAAAGMAGGDFSRRLKIPGLRTPASAQIRFRWAPSFGWTQQPNFPSG